MPYWKTYYHLVTATAHREPLINELREPIIYRAIEDCCRRYEMPLYAIGGIADHIRIVVSIPPSLSISKAVQYIKGNSSRVVNEALQDAGFGRQTEYGIETFAERHLDVVCRYVTNQKTHHANGTTNPRLERFEE